MRQREVNLMKGVQIESHQILAPARALDGDHAIVGAFERRYIQVRGQELWRSAPWRPAVATDGQVAHSRSVWAQGVELVHRVGAEAASATRHFGHESCGDRAQEVRNPQRVAHSNEQVRQGAAEVWCSDRQQRAYKLVTNKPGESISSIEAAPM